MGRTRQSDLLSAVRTLRERQGPRQHSSFKCVCLKPVAKTDARKLGGKRGWGELDTFGRFFLGDRNPNQGRALLYRKNCPSHKTGQSHVQKKDRWLWSPFPPCSPVLANNAFPESLCIFYSSETPPGWFSAEALCLAFKTPGKPVLLPLGYALH